MSVKRLSREDADMNRRTFFGSISAVAAATAVAELRAAPGTMPKMKITRVRVYSPPNPNPLFNQSDLVVTVDTDAGIMGIGEGGSRDMLEQCAGRLIGQDPNAIERCWQDMYRAFFYPPGREKMHALGALDLALWDIRGKALNRPVHALLGGMARNFCELYNTAGIIPVALFTVYTPGENTERELVAASEIKKEREFCGISKQRKTHLDKSRPCPPSRFKTAYSSRGPRSMLPSRGLPFARRT
jgi:hypothetical protein